MRKSPYEILEAVGMPPKTIVAVLLGCPIDVTLVMYHPNYSVAYIEIGENFYTVSEDVFVDISGNFMGRIRAAAPIYPENSNGYYRPGKWRDLVAWAKLREETDRWLARP